MYNLITCFHLDMSVYYQPTPVEDMLQRKTHCLVCPERCYQTDHEVQRKPYKYFINQEWVCAEDLNKLHNFQLRKHCSTKELLSALRTAYLKEERQLAYLIIDNCKANQELNSLLLVGETVTITSYLEQLIKRAKQHSSGDILHLKILDNHLAAAKRAHDDTSKYIEEVFESV